MKRVFKYPFEITDSFDLELPAGAKLLHVAEHDGKPCLWALVDEYAAKIPYHFELRGTGNPADGLEAQTYIATFTTHGGNLVWHLWRRAAKGEPVWVAPLTKRKSGGTYYPRVFLGHLDEGIYWQRAKTSDYFVPTRVDLDAGEHVPITEGRLYVHHPDAGRAGFYPVRELHKGRGAARDFRQLMEPTIDEAMKRVGL